jgi:protein-L-isoaspartate(D-aspartate) O-methyltransferase
VSSSVEIGSCVALPYEADEFDLAISINVFHNLISQDLLAALKEISRVSKMSYLVVESYDTELQKENLLYWQLTCEAFLRPEEWKWWFELAGYDRDYEFIFFD